MLWLLTIIDNRAVPIPGGQLRQGSLVFYTVRIVCLTRHHFRRPSYTMIYMEIQPPSIIPSRIYGRLMLNVDTRCDPQYTTKRKIFC